MSNSHLRTTNLFDLSIVTESFDTVLHYLTSQKDTTLIVCTPNPEQIVLAQENPIFKADLEHADVLLPDGAGVVVASRVLAAAGKCVPIRERITGIDLVIRLLQLAQAEKKTVLVLGGRGYGAPGSKSRGSTVVVEGSAANTHSSQSTHSQSQPVPLQLAPEFLPKSSTGVAHSEPQFFWLEGYAAIAEPTVAEEEQVEKAIKKLRPDYVCSAFGAPQQERWLIEHRSLLEKSGVELAIAVGGTFDILSGRLERAPEWIRSLHLEWFYRLVQEPWRWRRQIKLLHFIKATVQELLT